MTKFTIANFENKTVEQICDLLNPQVDDAVIKTTIGKLANLDQTGQSGVFDSGFETYVLAQTLFDQLPQAASLTSHDLKVYKSKHGIEDLAVVPIFDATQSVLPDFTKLSFEQLSQSMEENFVVMGHAIAEVKRTFAKSNFHSNWNNTILPTEKILLSLRRVENYLAIVENLHMPKSAAGLELKDYDARVVELKQTLAQLQVQLLQDPNYFKALLYVEEKSASLDAAQKCIVAYRVEQAKRVGAPLSDAEKIQLNEIKKKLTSLYAEFSANMAASAKSEALKITDATALAGLPESLTNKWKVESDGQTFWVIPVSSSNYSQIMQNCSVRVTRQIMYEKFFGRAAASSPNDNTIVFTQILTLRQEYAKLMGYENYTEMAYEQKSSFANVEMGETFLDNWLQTLSPFMRAQAALYDQALQTDGFAQGAFAPWDLTYYAKKVVGNTSGFQPQNYYFQLDEVRQEAFAQIENLFSVRISPKSDQSNVWHPDVGIYQVFDQDSQKLLGEFYWDPFTRDGKSGTNFTAEIQTGELSADGTQLIQVPVCLFNANFTANNLTIREAQTVFHELGHVMHMILGSQPYETLSGVPPMQQVSDLLEVPSIALEAWLYEPQMLVKIAHHKETNSNPILEDVEVWSRTLDPAKPFSLAAVATYGQADMAFHADVEHPENHPQIYDELLRQNVPYQLSDVPNVAFNTMPHMATDDYPGVYYQYALPRVIAPIIYYRAKDDADFLREAYSAGSSLSSAEFLYVLTGQEIDKISFEPALQFEHLK